MPFLSDIANLAAGLNPLITGALSSASQSRATNNLVAGGQQGINTIQTGAQNAQNTLATNLQAQKTALAPFVNPGAQAATTISNMQPYTPQLAKTKLTAQKTEITAGKFSFRAELAISFAR